MKNLDIEYQLLKKIIVESPYALMELCADDISTPSTVVVQAYLADGPNKLWCYCDEDISFGNGMNSKLVIMKFINRKRGNFIRLKGVAEMNGMVSKEMYDRYTADSGTQPLIKIEIHQVAWFHKKSGVVEFYA